jgi:hypothetical protein
MVPGVVYLQPDPVPSKDVVIGEIYANELRKAIPNMKAKTKPQMAVVEALILIPNRFILRSMIAIQPEKLVSS